MSAERRKGVYMISAVAELFGIHPQTLRLYEREGLLRPSRTDGNTRVYTDEDLEQLQTILNLRELGVNLAGVDIILNMRVKMQRMQEEITQFYRFHPPGTVARGKRAERAREERAGAASAEGHRSRRSGARTRDPRATPLRPVPEARRNGSCRR